MNKFKLSLLLLCILAFACTKENEEVEQIYAPEVKLVENWYATEFNAEKHQFLTYAKAPDWSKAVVSCTELSYVVEVPLLLNPDVKVISEDRLTQNIQMRLLFFCEGEDYSTAIAFIASQSNATDFLANTNNINYNYIDKGFNGMVNIFNLEQEMLETNLFVEGERNNFNSTLKSMQKDCYQIVEVFSDGSTKPVSAIYCTDNGLAGGGGGDYGGHEGPRDPGANPEQKTDSLTRIQIRKDLCDTFNGIINIGSIKENIAELSLPQEQFIIGLANIAAMNKLKLPLNNLKNDLKTFPINSDLYSKYSILTNHTRYTSNWSRVYNSSPNSDYALLSPKITNTNFQLKYYPEKNGEYNALGLVKEGVIDHGIETAIELLEVLGKNAGLPDDFLYDMHLYNALNFMEDYCNE